MNKFKPLLYAILIAVFVLVTFFGLGPVLFADGGMGERLLTLAVVIVIYIAICVIFIKIRKQDKI